MGAFVSCFHVPDGQGNPSSNNSSSEGCWCPNCFILKFKNMRMHVFAIRGTQSTSSDNQEHASSNSEVVDDYSSNASRFDSSELSEDDRSILFQEMQAEMRGRQGKGTSHSRVEPEPVLQTLNEINSEFVQKDKTISSSSSSNIGSVVQKSDSSVIIVTQEVESGFTYTFPLPDGEDEEDVCPTCLEEYDEENPKIFAKCSHHYHLSCIYEWMERSTTCPVCREELMLFDE